MNLRSLSGLCLALLPLCFIPLALAEAPSDPLLPCSIQHHDLKLELDPERSFLQAEDLITLQPQTGASLKLLLRKGLTVTGVWMNNQKTNFVVFPQANAALFEAEVDSDDSSYYQRAQMISVDLAGKTSKSGTLTLKVAYAGILKDSLEGADFSREYVAMQVTGILSSEGIYLAPEGIFYPTLPRQTFTYSVQITLPEAYQTVSEGMEKPARVQKGKRTETWVCQHPLDGFHVIANRFDVKSVEHAGVKISTYFFPDTTDLADKYLQACQNYVDLYDSLIGPYPFEKFAVVENFFATGYGMPSFTLLGSEVIRLPFIISTSLGHEVCHNWWGNSVYVDYHSGNWCEGLTTYCADYLYKERQSPVAAREYRLNLLQDYTAYTHDQNDFALTDFVTRHNPAQRAVGYGKSAMVYHMLRQRLGDRAFWAALRAFYQNQKYKFAAWNDLQQAFTAPAAESLGWFFDQWVKRIGAPSLSLGSPTLTPAGQGWVIHFLLQQKQAEEPYRLTVPVRVRGDAQDTTFFVALNQREAQVELKTSFQPVSFSVDPNFDLFRRLDRAEVPPTLSEVFGAPNLIIVLPTQGAPEAQQAYATLADQFNREGHYRLVKDSEVTPDDLSKNALFFLGSPEENRALPASWLQGRPWSSTPAGYRLLEKDHTDPTASLLTVMRHPDAANLSIAHFSGRTAPGIAEAGRKLMHYGKYSYLIFYGGKNQVKGVWEVTDSPLTYHF